MITKNSPDSAIPLKLPFYAKAALFILGMYALISMLCIAQDLILPLLYGIIVAILMSPVVNFMVRKKINRAVAIILVMIVVLLIIAGLVTLLIAQASLMSEAIPQLAEKFQALFNQFITWISGCLEISPKKINTWIDFKKSELLNNSGAAIGITLTTMTGVLSTVFLTPVYIFMFLLYEPHLTRFIKMLFGVINTENVKEISTETKTIVQAYLIGLLAELVIIAVLNSIGLMILGIKYAILLGIIGAFLNIIPYLGGIISMAIFAIIALVTKSPVYILYVIGLYTIIQFIDNNYIVPKIVGSKVKLNALISLVTVIAGAALWGIPGMFLSIPLTAILKVILDRFESLKPWGFLLGDDLAPLLRLKVAKSKSLKVP